MYVVNIIGPVISNGGNEIVKNITSDLWDKVKSVFNKKGEDKVIEAFKETPADPSVKERVVDILEEELKQDENLKQEILELIRAIRKTDDYKNFVSQIGDKNIAVTGKINNSAITINK